MDKTKILITNGSLIMKVKSIARGAFCNTFDLHQAIIDLKTHFRSFRELPFYTGFTVCSFLFALCFTILAFTRCNKTHYFYMLFSARPQGYKKKSYSTQMSMKFQLLIKTKISTIKIISCIKSLRCCIYHA